MPTCCFCLGVKILREKKELVEATYIERIEVDSVVPPDESAGLIEIENEKIIVKISPSSGKVWEVRLKEHTYLKNDSSLGVRLFGFNEHSFTNTDFSALNFSYHNKWMIYVIN